MKNISKAQKINFENRRRGRPPESARVGLRRFSKFDFRSFTNNGSSLLETLIYAAILGLVAVFTTGSILAMMRSYTSVKMSRDLNLSASVAMERMTNEIRLANGIDDSGSVFGASHGKLKLYTIDSSGAPATIEFSLPLNGTGVFAKESGGVSEALTSSTTEVTNLVFNEITSSTISKAVKISLTVKAKNGRMEKTENFYNTAILRGSY
jgi:hypothetical protein